MRISSVRVQNYKCFRDTGEIPLSPGMNVIVGRNDAGKSAFLEALSLQAGQNPHRSQRVMPTPDTPVDQASKVTVSYDISSEELTQYFQRQPMIVVRDCGGYDETVRKFHTALAKGRSFRAVWLNQNPQTGLLDALEAAATTTLFHIGNGACPTGLALSNQGTSGGTPDFGNGLASQMKSRVYAFRAERLNVAVSNVAGTQELQTNAANLADVLNQLGSTNPSRYERLMGHVRTIFPHVTQVTAAFVGSNSARIAVWTAPVDSERADLAIPLSDSGTGIGQVLAMLYVVVTSDTPRVIVIDEPQSFLHPGAVRKLLEILRSYPQHQYIISTHSPVALALSDEDSMLMIRRDEAKQESIVERIDPKRAEDVRGFLDEVGARLGDVFGADSILWVEGKTEETCFPELIRKVANVPLQGVQILGVISTDELTTRFAHRVFDIYARLSGQTSLLPPAVAFFFDREGRSDTDRADIERKSNNLVRWLPRRMYENYLLEPESIGSVLASQDALAQEPITLDAVRTWLHEHGSDQRYFPAADNAEYGTDDWYLNVHGGKLLHDLFASLSEARVEYDKVKHGLLLTQYLIDNPTSAIRDLAGMLADLVASA